MEKKTTGHTIYERILRMSVLGILVTMVLATGAGLSLDLMNARQDRKDTLVTAVHAVSHTLTITDETDSRKITEYVDRTVSGISGIDLFAVYKEDGTPVYFCDITGSTEDPSDLESLDSGLMERLAQSSDPILDGDQAPSGADYCAFAAVRRTDGTIKGYVMAGMYLRSIRSSALRTLGIYLAIGLVALGLGTFLSQRLARHIKQDLLGYEPDAFRDLFLRRMELLDALDEGLLAIDKDTHIIYINRAASEMLSLEKNLVLGKPLSEVYPQSTIAQVIQTKQPEFSINLRSLRHVQILSDRMPVFRDGEIVGVVAIFRNRTEVANLARELTGVQHMVEAMRAYTHEFMNKLHVILGLLQLGEYRRAEEYVLQITQTRALSVARISQSIAEPSVAALLIGKSCRAAELGVRMNLDPESRLGADTRFLPPSSLITLLGNLIENAFDAFKNTPSDTLHEIDVSLREGERGLILSVDDNACGIPEEMLEHIFERGKTTKGIGHGTGLFLVKQIVDANGGEIRVESTPGVGSSFIITFRADQAE